jgi:hypothetical protein
MALGANSPGGKEDIEACAGSEIQHDLARLELGKHRRVATTKANRFAQADLLELSREIGAVTAAVWSVRLAAARVAGGPHNRELVRQTSVPGSHRFFHITHLPGLL